MRLAPMSSLHGSIVPTANGNAGTFATLRTMRQMVNAAKTDINIRQTAASIVYLTPEKNALAEVDALYCFVRDHIRYTADVNDVETLTAPLKTLEIGYGDCDDQTMLLAALLESIGYVTKFVIAGYNSPDAFEHVYLRVLADGYWVDLDPTEPYNIGEAAPGAVCMWVES